MDSRWIGTIHESLSPYQYAVGWLTRQTPGGIVVELRLRSKPAGDD